MSCNKMKRKISSLLDGRLSDKHQAVLNGHLSRCPSCREYKNQLMRLSSEVREREKNEMSKDYSLEFSLRLKSRLLNVHRQKKHKDRVPGFEKWAYMAAGFIAVLFLLVYFVVLQPATIQTEEYFVLSYEDAMGDIYEKINNDPELEELFNTIILASLMEVLEDLDEETIPFIIKNPLYEENISEEDLKILESKIKLEREEDITS